MSNMKLIMENWRGFLKEEKEAPQAFYHLSPFRFETFKQAEYPNWRKKETGFHFGTKDTVMSVADKLKKEGRVKSGDSVYLYSVNLNIQNPLHLEENRLGSWAISDIIITMFEGPKGDGTALPIFSDKQIDDYYEDVVTTPSGENLKDMFMMPHEEEAKEFLSWFYSLGYDSIKYENKFEAAGESILVFNPNQIKILNVEEFEVP